MFHRPRQDTTDKSGKEQDTRDNTAEAGNNTVNAASQPQKASGGPAPVAKPPAQNQQQSNQQASTSKEKNMSNENKDDQNNKGRPLDIPGQKSGYQPTAAQKGPGSYGAGAYPGANTQSSTDTAGKGRRLIIGQGITMSGEIEACEYLVVEGTVEAALKGAKVLEIADSGTFYGTVEIDEATIAGRFEGDITVKGRLTVTSSGSITGTLSYGELAVEAGATLDGKISPLAGGSAASKDTSDKKSKKGKSEGKGNAAARNDNDGKDKDKGKSDDEESELPFANTATAAAE